uniref:Uncharacterized protein n=1 Tax=Panagrolaimus davidi TaxID=227884 RepID=A0A914P9F1_9BILA
MSQCVEVPTWIPSAISIGIAVFSTIAILIAYHFDVKRRMRQYAQLEAEMYAEERIKEEEELLGFHRDGEIQVLAENDGGNGSVKVYMRSSSKKSQHPSPPHSPSTVSSIPVGEYTVHLDKFDISSDCLPPIKNYLLQKYMSEVENENDINEREKKIAKFVVEKMKMDFELKTQLVWVIYAKLKGELINTSFDEMLQEHTGLIKSIAIQFSTPFEFEIIGYVVIY